jgi:CheY-like chemotaxis protein
MDYLTNGESQYPDVLFLDLNMPLKNGYECVAEIRSMDHLKKLPVAIISTSSLDERLRAVLKKYNCFYIKKPGSYPELIRAIASTLGITSRLVKIPVLPLA